MAVTEVRLLTDRKGKLAERRDRSFTRTYLVTTNDRQDGPLTVAAELPNIGDFYVTTNESDFGARVSAIDIDTVDSNPFLWRATVEYSNRQREDHDEPEPEDPTDRDPIYAIRFDKHDVPVTGPYSTVDPGNVSATTSLTNSKKQPYNPPPTREELRPVITITVNDHNLDLLKINAMQDCVNSAAFAGFPAKTLKLNVTGITEQFENGIRYWEKTYELAHRRQTWDLFLLDHGTIPDKEGNFKEVLLLNGSETTGAPQYHQYTIYRQVDFAAHSDIPPQIKALGSAPN